MYARIQTEKNMIAFSMPTGGVAIQTRVGSAGPNSNSLFLLPRFGMLAQRPFW